MYDLNNAARRSYSCVCHGKVQGRWKCEGEGYSDKGCEECRNDVETDDWLECRPCADAALRHGVHDEHEDENRRDSLQGADKDIAEHGDEWDEGRRIERDGDADDETDRDKLDKRRLAVLAADVAEQVDSSLK